MCPLNVGVACIDKFERRGSRDEARCCDAVELLPFPNSPKQLRILSSKGRKQFLTCTHMAESCWQLGRAGLGVLGRNVNEAGWKLVLPRPGNCDFSFLGG